MAEPTTVRLHNIDPNRTQLSLHLLWPMNKTAPRLRRGVNMHPIRIPPGRYYDICKELGCDLEDARRVAQSPEVILHRNGNRLLVREFPPTEEQVAVEEKEAAGGRDAQKQTAALNPPDPPEAVPVGIDLEAAGLDPSTPRMTRVPEKTKVEEISDEVEPTSNEVEVEPEISAVAESGEPSMDWNERALRKYAEDNNISIKGAMSKTAILKAIRKGMTTRE